jgi:hypothetical protein
MIKVLWNEMSFMETKLVYTVSNTWNSCKVRHEIPTETGLIDHYSKSNNHCLFETQHHCQKWVRQRTMGSDLILDPKEIVSYHYRFKG